MGASWAQSQGRDRESLEQHAREIFRTMDHNADGHISKHDLVQALRAMKLPPTPEHQMDAFFNKLDTNQDSLISESEFVSFVMQREQEVWRIFEKIDKSKDLELGKEEIMASLSSLGVKPNADDIDGLIKLLDDDQNHQVSWREFRDFLLLLPVSEPLDSRTAFRRWIATTSVKFGEISFTIPDETMPVLQKTDKSWVVFTSGAAAGVVSRTLTAPIDRMKIIMQMNSVQHPGLLSVFRQIKSDGGWTAFFRGNGTNVIKVAPESAVKFFVYDRMQTLLKKSGFLRASTEHDKRTTILEKLVAGATAGLVAMTCIYPLEIAKTRLAASSKGTYNGMLDCLAQTIRKDGYRGLTRGWAPSAVGIIPYAAVDLGVYTTLRDRFVTPDSNGNLNPLAVLSCGAVSSSAGQIVS
jgi:solute carrier family 25 phosphate transporter 23/24/25/41